MFDGLFDSIKDMFAWAGKALLWVTGGVLLWKLAESLSGKDLGFNKVFDGVKDAAAKVTGRSSDDDDDGERQIGNLDKYVSGQTAAWDKYKAQHAGEKVSHKIPLAYKDIKAVSGKGDRDIGHGVKHHDGVDLKVEGVANPEILASEKGVVLYSGVIGGYGNTVIIGHGDGTLTLYGHLQKDSNAVVKTGEEVRQGQKIGVMGNTGHSQNVHLHYEQRIGADRTIVPELPELGDLSHDVVNQGVKSKRPEGVSMTVSPAASAASGNGFVPVSVPRVQAGKGSAVAQKI
jgi:murein DD-endopeptidase MepM/ murein hydrolase activator NlpD